jgi:N-acetylmuramoyl-L-alanine amidase
MPDSLDRTKVADVQRRLAALGHDPSADPPGTLGLATSFALQAFQRERGLPITGSLDPECYARIIEAGWRLGERLLYLDRPLQRGDDVAALQEALAMLGFNPGRIDGIFGPLTDGALREFQGNVALETSGVLTRQSLAELSRLSTRGGGRRLVTEAHDTVGMGSARRLVIVSGASELAEQVATNLEEIVAVVRTGARDDHEVAQLANEAGAGLVLAVRLGAGEDLECQYFASYRAHSVVGRSFAEAIVEGCHAAIPSSAKGMSVALLRETTMPTVIVVVHEQAESLFSDIAAAVASSATVLFNRSR